MDEWDLKDMDNCTLDETLNKTLLENGIKEFKQMWLVNWNLEVPNFFLKDGGIPRPNSSHHSKPTTKHGQLPSSWDSVSFPGTLPLEGVTAVHACFDFCSHQPTVKLFKAYIKSSNVCFSPSLLIHSLE